MRQRSRLLGPAAVCHQPAGHGDRHGDERQESRYDQGDDKADHGHADVLHPLGLGSCNYKINNLRPDTTSKQTFRRVHESFLTSLERQNRVGLDCYFFSELAGDQVSGQRYVGVVLGVFDVALAAAEGVVTATVHLEAKLYSENRLNPTSTYRLAASEAHPNVALEPDVVAAGELERVEASQEALGVGVVFPLSEDRGVGGAAVLISHEVLVLHVVFHRFGHTTPGEATVY